MSNDALGMIETLGLTPAIHAGDTMAKAANVEIMGYRNIGSGFVSIMVKGDVGAVVAAVDAGVEAANVSGRVVSHLVIPRPYDNMMETLLAFKGKKKEVFKTKNANVRIADSTVQTKVEHKHIKEQVVIEEIMTEEVVTEEVVTKEVVTEVVSEVAIEANEEVTKVKEVKAKQKGEDTQIAAKPKATKKVNKPRSKKDQSKKK